MSESRYRVIYGKTHDSVHISDDLTRRRLSSLFDNVDELNINNDIIVAMYNFIKEQGMELIVLTEEYETKWMIVKPEDISKYNGAGEIKTYKEYLESLRK